MAIDDIRKIIQSAVDTITDRRTLDKLGEDLVERIKTRTRTGKGVREPEARPHRLPALKTNTKRNRRRLKRQGGLTGPGATPAKSGVNRTGTTLNSMSHRVQDNEIQIRLDAKGEDVAEDLIRIDKDYTFMNVSQPEIKAFVEALEKEIEKKIK